MGPLVARGVAIDTRKQLEISLKLIRFNDLVINPDFSEPAAITKRNNSQNEPHCGHPPTAQRCKHGPSNGAGREG